MSSYQPSVLGHEEIEDAARDEQARLGRATLRSTPGLYRRAWQRYRRDHIAMASLVVTAAVIAFAVGAPLVSRLTGFTYAENHLSWKLSSPGEHGYVLGSDGNGRDVL